MADLQYIELLLEGVDAWNAAVGGLQSGPDLSNINLFEELERRGFQPDQGAMKFERFDFKTASFSDTDLTYVWFSECDFREAKLQGTRLDRSSFSQCRLEGMKLNDASGSEASFTDCEFPAQPVSFASFEQSWFTRCDMSKAGFNATSFRYSSFEDCRVAGMRVSTVCYRTGWQSEECYYSSLEGVSGLSQEDIASMRLDPSVTLPDGLEHVK
ncbi:pentapeptide repeat-containing protein [Pacificoceanicola onchidii]|uniref:pentapeptide repeat-containing protein n=1 Tax=Pacificoceanicola onchidii TaxID=2562685 RepID=UPI0010A6572A|nr:pentapeptide repeat-containing protein [Pacificoceanicola onchidii]